MALKLITTPLINLHFIRLLKSNFIKNMSVVMTGTAISQIFGFLLSPIIARLFNPTEFGVFGTYNSVVATLSVITTFQYSYAILLPKHKKDALHVFFMSIFSIIISVIFFAIVIFIFPYKVLSLIKSDNFYILPLILLAISFNGLNETFQNWAIRSKAFINTSISQILRTLMTNLTTITTGILNIGVIGLITGSLIGIFSSIISLLKVFIKDKKGFAFKWNRLIILKKRYKDFPIYSTPQTLMNQLSRNTPVLLISHFFSIEAAGSYAFGLKVLRVPMNFILTALKQVLFQKVSEKYNHGLALFPLYRKIILGLFVLIIFPTIFLFIWTPSIFQLFFGLNWKQAGIFARWLILWLFAAFLNSPTPIFIRILQLQKSFFFLEIITLISRISIIVFGGFYLDVNLTITAFSIVGAILNLIPMFWISKKLIEIEKPFYSSI